MMKCPHCGWKYDPYLMPTSLDTAGLVPMHNYVINSPIYMSAAALDSGAVEEEVKCPGSMQIPRNAESDRRLLWKDEP
jgi:hypothetical protein